MSSKPSHFRFRTADNIGAAAAEDDEFLKDCFVDTGHLQLLSDLSDRRLIVLGRTGAGKSALLTILEQEKADHVIRISAEQLALTYVANSNILNFFSSLGVNLDPFFKLLWRHLLTVEILARHFSNQEAADESQSLTERVKRMFLGTTRQDKEMRQAIAYLEQWGRSFWEDTEFRVKEITQQVETKLNAEARATLGPKIAAIGTGLAAAERFTESERTELVSRGQDVVSKAQVQDLHRVLKLLDAVLTDKQNGYYLVVDRLDENWVEERLRYKLIMALLQTAREFNEVRHAKVIVALRRDLIDRVFRLTRDSGFQEEKYQSLYVPLVWSRDDILEVLDKRISRLVARRYTKAAVTHREVLPKAVQRVPIGDYIFSLAPRPRDVIALFNICIGAATDQPKLGTKEFRLAEGEYSRTRLRALADEWSVDQPLLADFAKILQKRSTSFKIKTIADTDIEDLCLAIAADNPSAAGLTQSALQVSDCTLPAKQFKLLMVRTFYQVGLVGLKLAPYESESWADELGRGVSFPEINEETSVVVHPAYRRALGIGSP